MGEAALFDPTWISPGLLGVATGADRVECPSRPVAHDFAAGQIYARKHFIRDQLNAVARPVIAEQAGPGAICN
jgi:hypothetical protein